MVNGHAWERKTFSISKGKALKPYWMNGRDEEFV